MVLTTIVVAFVRWKNMEKKVTIKILLGRVTLPSLQDCSV